MKSPIEEYLAELRRIGVSLRHVAEAEDHLGESAANHEASGMSIHDAQLRAIADFGSTWVLLEGGQMLELELTGVREHIDEGGPFHKKPVALLKEKEGDRYLPIFIGKPEAWAIANPLLGTERKRPLTHDFFVEFIQALDDVSVERLVITKIQEFESQKTFFAELQISHHGSPSVIDCRPSDGIALAVRLGLPIYANEQLSELLIHLAA